MPLFVTKTRDDDEANASGYNGGHNPPHSPVTDDALQWINGRWRKRHRRYCGGVAELGGERIAIHNNGHLATDNLAFNNVAGSKAVTDDPDHNITVGAC